MRTLAIAAALAAATLAAAPSRATVVAVPTLEEMAIASDVVAEVEVGDATVRQNNGRIVTLTSLTVKHTLKGAQKAGDALVVYQLGGTFDGKSAWIAGAHRFVKGEHLVIFAMKSMHQKDYGPNAVVPYGIGFGLFNIVDDLTGPKVEELVGDVVTVDGKVPPVRKYDSLASFEATVKAAASMKDVPQAPRMQKLQPKLPGVR